jgi:DNA-binding winged helix-turn-helix (wHTH) protein
MPDRKRVRFLDFELDFGRFELYRGREAVAIERLPLELLMLLVENPGQLITRKQIREKLWSEDFVADVEGINTAVHKIRIALQDDPSHPKCLKTVVGKGYRFVADATSHCRKGQLPVKLPVSFIRLVFFLARSPYTQCRSRSAPWLLP